MCVCVCVCIHILTQKTIIALYYCYFMPPSASGTQHSHAKKKMYTLATHLQHISNRHVPHLDGIRLKGREVGTHTLVDRRSFRLVCIWLEHHLSYEEKDKCIR